MNRFNYLIFTFCLFLFVFTKVEASDSLARKFIPIIGFEFKPGYTIPTDDFFKGENKAQKPINTTLSGHLKYGFKYSPDTYLGKIYPNTIQGIGVGYNTFFNSKELGNPFSIYVFQSSKIADVAPNLSIDYEWNFGVSFGWKKRDEIKNPYNLVVGSSANAYINIGFLLNWKMASNTNLRAGVGVTHFSNGNTSYPNSGVNTVGASIGVTKLYDRQRSHVAKRSYSPKEKTNAIFNRYVNYDLIIYGATRMKGVFPEGRDPMLVPGKFAIVGVNFNPLYNFSKFFRAGFSLDFQYDESANIGSHIVNENSISGPQDLRFYRPSFREQFSVGLSVRAEIVMPIFSINLGVGKNFICKGDDTNSFYQTFVLKTDITKNLFLHTGYQLYKFKDPNNLMIGLGVRF